MNIQPVPHIPSPEAETLARELVSIATNTEYGDLRDDMVGEVLAREFPHQMVSEPKQAALTLALIVKLLAGALEVLADEIGGERRA